MMLRGFFALLLFAGMAHAQQYRWVDEQGRVQYSDTAPPPSARDVKKMKPGFRAPAAAPQQSFELTRLQKDFPVTLFTSPNCVEGCAMARAALNNRGVPFTEVQVWDEESNERLKRVAGALEVPTLQVGSSTHRGFEQGAFDSLLDSAGYPKAGALPVGAQKPPAAPEGYVPPSERPPAPVAEPLKPEPSDEPQKLGPYAPGGRR
jgi:glutaredoxin